MAMILKKNEGKLYRYNSIEMLLDSGEKVILSGTGNLHGYQIHKIVYGFIPTMVWRCDNKDTIMKFLNENINNVINPESNPETLDHLEVMAEIILKKCHSVDEIRKKI